MQYNTAKRAQKTHKVVVHKQARAKMVRFNMSGRAVTVDDLMNLDAKVTKVPGRSRWKKWLPEAIQKAAFSQGSLRAIAKSMQDGHGPHAKRKYSPTTVMQCRHLASLVVTNGTARGVHRLCHESRRQRFGFWITNSMFDESKLWYMVKGSGYRHYSTLAWHTQCTWKERWYT